MYVGTNDGLYVISKFKDNSNFRIDHYGTSEGLVDLETNLNSSYLYKRSILLIKVKHKKIEMKRNILNKKTALSLSYFIEVSKKRNS